jgi:chromosome segregation ATPase
VGIVEDSEVIMSIALYIFMTISGIAQFATVAYVAYVKRGLTQAEAVKTAADATQVTANSFNTMTMTLTTVATDLSSTLLKTIDSLNARENQIDALQTDNRNKSNDLEDLRRQFSEIANAAAARETEIALLKDSLVLLKRANENQAEDIISLKARVLGVEDDNKKLREENRQKDEDVKERDRIISNRDDRIKQLETRVKHLEDEIAELKKPVPPPEEKVVEVKVVETKTEGANPS